MTDASESPTITDADLAGLNQRALLRVVRMAERLSTVLFIVAALLALAWVWSALRQQGVIDSSDGDIFSPFDADEDLSWKARVDFFATTLSLLGLAAVVFGIGAGIRAYCAVAIVRAGGSLTGWQVGEEIDPDPVDLERP